MNIVPVKRSCSQDVDNEVSQVTVDCLSNSVIVKKIMEHFSHPELLELSFVKKMWNYEARCVMRDRGNVIARLRCNSSNPCQQVLEAFGADLQQMNVVPFTGLFISIHPEGHTGHTVALDPTHEAILARLTLKRFAVGLIGKWEDFINCPALVLVKKLLQNFSGVIEQLGLSIEKNREEFIEHFVRDCNFPCLKILALEDGENTLDATYTNYLKVLVSRAPNLEKLTTYGPINLMANVLEGSKAVLLYESEVFAPFKNVSESVIGTLRLEFVELIHTGPEFDFARFNRIAPILLAVSCTTTLYSMYVDAVLAVPLMSYGICFENVDQLNLSIHYYQLERAQPRILNIVKDFDFARIFPNLESVEIVGDCRIELSPDHMNAIIGQADAVLREPMPNRAANVKELYIDHWNLSSVSAPFFAEMFPNIQKLKVDAAVEEQLPFGCIGQYWPDLKELHVV